MFDTNVCSFNHWCVNFPLIVPMLEPGLVTVSCAEWVTGFLNFILDTFHMNVGILFTTKQATNHSHQNKSFHSIKNPAIKLLVSGSCVTCVKHLTMQMSH